jgi:hypothetical protein
MSSDTVEGDHMTNTTLNASEHADRPAVDAPDLTGYHLVHRALRAEARHLAWLSTALRTPRQLRTFRWLWNGFAGELHCHHTAEDRVMFPALAERLGSNIAFERTDLDHARLDELLEHVSAIVAKAHLASQISGLRPVLEELAGLLTGHLAYEDETILPRFAEQFDAAEYQQLEEGVLEVLGVSRQALFTVPFLLSFATADERASMLAGAPRPFVIMYRLTRRGFARRMRRLPIAA